MLWKILSILSLIVPIAALLLGLICWRYPPKGPNWIIGFRSRRARAGDEAWAFAQQWAGKLWFVLGLVLLLVSLLLCNGQAEASAESIVKSCFILIAVQALCLALMYLGLEIVLLYRFDRFGKPRLPKQQRAQQRQEQKLQRAQRRRELLWDDDEEESDEEYDEEYDGEYDGEASADAYDACDAAMQEQWQYEQYTDAPEDADI